MQNDSGVKFIRVKGKVVPIKADQVGGIKRKKVRESASDNVSKQDAVKSLRKTARDSQKRKGKYDKGYAFSSVAGLGFFAGAIIARNNPALRQRFGAAGLASVGLATASKVASSKEEGYSKQLRKDASRIAKDKPLSETKITSQSARAYSSIFSRGLPMAPSTVPIAPRSPGDTSI